MRARRLRTVRLRAPGSRRAAARRAGRPPRVAAAFTTEVDRKLMRSADSWITITGVSTTRTRGGADDAVHAPANAGLPVADRSPIPLAIHAASTVSRPQRRQVMEVNTQVRQGRENPRELVSPTGAVARQ